MNDQPKKIATLTYLVVSSQPHLTRMMQNFFVSIGGAKVEYVNNSSEAMLHLQHDSICDVVISEYDTKGGILELCKYIRWGRYFYAPKLPILTIGNNWTPEKVQQARNAGINELVSFPISTHIMIGRLLSAINTNRLFISTETYRGPDRRRATSTGFSGPFRRASDRISGKLRKAADIKQKKEARLLQNPIAVSESPQQDSKTTPILKTSDVNVTYTPFSAENPIKSASDEKSHDPIINQTGKVIKDAYATSQRIISLTSLSTDGLSDDKKRKLAEDICEYTERFINLMVLGRDRIVIYGCTDDHFEILTSVLDSFSTCVQNVIGVELELMIGRYQGLANDASPLPMGVGMVIGQRMAVINGLVSAIGGEATLEPRLLIMLTEVVSFIDKILIREEKVIGIKEL